MKDNERVLVMNGSRIFQIEKNGQWKNGKVTRAGNLNPGIYNLYSAEPADPNKTYAGTIIHVDQKALYQTNGKKIVKHDLFFFGDEIPEIGDQLTIRYVKGQAQTGPAEKIKRGLSR
ncbi:MAG: conjugal transfer protein TraO [Alphaproteobacteria bacterium]|nr:conjugal transfer protein TraO [Alphaproteobacteria bacterium]